MARVRSYLPAADSDLARFPHFECKQGREPTLAWPSSC
jgi:hypothetical protein